MAVEQEMEFEPSREELDEIFEHGSPVNENQEGSFEAALVGFKIVPVPLPDEFVITTAVVRSRE